MKMSKTTPSVFALIMAICPLLTAQTFESKDNSRQINLPNNAGTVNINQYLVKSEDYKALTKQLDDVDKDIKEKIDDCAAFETVKMTERLDKCRLTLTALNKKRDSMSNVLSQFKDDVLRLAETFEKTPINSERLRKAKALFDAGKIREVQFVMNDKEMTAEGDALLLERKRLEKRLERNDSLLQVKATEFHIKAQAKALDFADPLRIDSTAFCYRQALRYADEAQTVLDFANFLRLDHQYDSAFVYYPKLIANPKAEDWQIANAYGNIGELHRTTGNLEKAFQADIKLIEAYQRLNKREPNNTFYKQNLAISYEKLGQTHSSLGNLDKALTFNEKANQTIKELYTAYPTNVEFKNGLAISYEKLGSTHTALGNLDKALTFFEEYNRLLKDLYTAYTTNVSFKNGLALSYQWLGWFFETKRNDKKKAKEHYQNSKQLLEALVKAYPRYVEFQNNLKWVEDKLSGL